MCIALGLAMSRQNALPVFLAPARVAIPVFFLFFMLFQPPSLFESESLFLQKVTFLVLLSVFLISGCQTYNPQSIDPSAHEKEWAARDASSESVAKYAERIGISQDSFPSFDVSDGLTLREGTQVALIFNPDLRLARLRAGVAKANAKHAGLWDDPELSIDVLNITESVPDPWLIGSALAFTIPVSGRLKVEKERAEAERHAELERVSELEWELMRDLAVAWLEWSAERYHLEETKAVLVELDSVVTSTSSLVEAGELLRTEAARFSIEQANRRAEYDRIKAAKAEKEQSLRSLLGITPSAPLELIPTLAAAFLSTKKNEPSPNHPTLLRLKREHEVADKTLLREIKKQYPDITFGPQGESDEGQSRIGFVGVVPIPILNSNKGGIATARAEREVALASYETEYEEMVGQLAVFRARLSGIQSRRSTLTKTLVPLVDQQLGDAKRLLELGEGDGLVLFESLLQSHEAKLRLIGLYFEEAKVRFEIRYLLGPESKK